MIGQWERVMRTKTVNSADIGAYESVAGVTADGGSNSRCFIATAAYGSPMEPQVRYLRAFRDQYLLTNEPGRKFVELYYTVSPPVADFIREHASLREIVRTGLEPLVTISRWLVTEPVRNEMKRRN